jgi:BlaI family penicillinase repressor
MRQSKKDLQLPTRAEGRLLRALWSLGEATVEEIVSTFPAAQRPNYKTAQTVLRTMETKAFVEHRISGKAFIYRPLVTELEVRQASVESLVDQTFGGSMQGLMMNLIEADKLKRSDLIELEDLIRRHKEMKQ